MFHPLLYIIATTYGYLCYITKSIINMKRNVIQPSALQLPEELQQEQEKLNLPQSATATEQLYVINHYLPRTTNLAENLTVLHHLKLSNRDIADILCGGAHYLYGEICSLKHSTVKVICCGVKVTIDDVGGRYQVCLDGKTVEGFIKIERDRQRELEKMVTGSTKEDLVKEIRKLRREIKHLNENLTVTKNLNETLVEYQRLSEKTR